jgi:phosphatidate phosphatase APP1
VNALIQSDIRWPAVVRMALTSWLAACLCNSLAYGGSPHNRQIVFAPSMATSMDGRQWSVQVQGRISEPAEGSRGRQKAIDLLAPLAGADRHAPIYRARAGGLVSDSIRNVRVSVRLGKQIVRLERSDAAGYFSGEVPLSAQQITQLSRDGVIPFESEPMGGNPRRFKGVAVLVPDEGVTVVTDMDDTIKETHILNRSEARANTLVRPFRAVSGMPDLYRAWKAALEPRIHFHVVSAGPWQMHEPLRQFTENAGFPDFSWDMRSVDVTAPAALIAETIKADPERLYAFKLSRIRALMMRLPKRSFVLVGDSGEKDPEVYAAILAEFPQRVDAVYIRNVTDEGRNASRYTRLYPDADAMAKLRVFISPDELPRELVARR